MASIVEFGTAGTLQEFGYQGIGVVTGTDSEVLDQFFSDRVCLVRGAQYCNEDCYEFFVMVGDTHNESPSGGCDVNKND